MARILLTQQKVATVDDCDFDELSQYKWFAKHDGWNYYAARNIPTENHKQTTIRMHQAIMKPPPGMEVDHINNNTMDNRRANLRICSHAENVRNSPHKNGTSKYRGVTWHKKDRRWTVSISYMNKKIRLGGYKNEECAAKEYDRNAIKLHGKYAILNFPKGISDGKDKFSEKKEKPKLKVLENSCRQ